MALRLAAESLAALALPPFDAPNLLKASAAGFFPASGFSSGLPSICSPMACSTTRRAFAKKSRPLLARLGIPHHVTIGGRREALRISNRSSASSSKRKSLTSGASRVHRIGAHSAVSFGQRLWLSVVGRVDRLRAGKLCRARFRSAPGPSRPPTGARAPAQFQLVSSRAQGMGAGKVATSRSMTSTRWRIVSVASLGRRGRFSRR
jgi:hypothetical protein